MISGNRELSVRPGVRWMLLALFAGAAAAVMLVLGASNASAAPGPQPIAPVTLTPAASAALTKAGLTCEGGVCTRADGKQLNLTLRNLNLEGWTFRDVNFSLLTVLDSNMSGVRFENCDLGHFLSGGAAGSVWRNAVITSTLDRQLKLEGRMDRTLDADGFTIENMNIVRLTLGTGQNLSKAVVTRSTVGNQTTTDMINSSLKTFTGNQVVRDGWIEESKGESRQLLGEGPGGLGGVKRIEGVDFSGSTLDGTLHEARLINCDLSHTTLKGWWDEVEIKGGSLAHADIQLTANRLTIDTASTSGLQNAKFDTTSCNNCVIKGNAQGASFAGTRLVDTDLSGIKTTNRDLPEGKYAISFEGATGETVTLPKEMRAWNLKGFNGSAVTIPAGTKAQGSNWENADLRNQKTTASGKNSFGEKLDFSDADLTNSKWDRNAFTETSFNGAKFDRTTFKSVTFTGETGMRGTQLTEVDFGQSKIEKGHVTFLQSVWNSIKEFFGFGKAATVSLNGTTIKGTVTMTDPTIVDMSWRNTTFEPHSELVLANLDTAIAVGRQIVAEPGVTGIENLRLSVKNGYETVRVVEAGTRAEISARLLELTTRVDELRQQQALEKELQAQLDQNGQQTKDADAKVREYLLDVNREERTIEALARTSTEYTTQEREALSRRTTSIDEIKGEITAESNSNAARQQILNSKESELADLNRANPKNAQAIKEVTARIDELKEAIKASPRRLAQLNESINQAEREYRQRLEQIAKDRAATAAKQQAAQQRLEVARQQAQHAQERQRQLLEQQKQQQERLRAEELRRMELQSRQLARK